MSWKDAVLGLGAAMEAVDKAAQGLMDAPDTLDLLNALADVRELRKTLQQIESLLETAAARAMGDDRLEVPGLVATRRGGARRKWAPDHADLISSRLLESHYVTEQGEIDQELAKVIEDARADLLECAHIDYWKTTLLTERGIKFSDCCETTFSRRTVQVDRAKTEDGVA